VIVAKVDWPAAEQRDGHRQSIERADGPVKATARRVFFRHQPTGHVVGEARHQPAPKAEDYGHRISAPSDAAARRETTWKDDLKEGAIHRSSEFVSLRVSGEPA